MTSREVLVHQGPDALAAAAAQRLVSTVSHAQESRGVAAVVLTGGGTGIGVLEHVRASAARDSVDWSAVDFYWGDERFVPDGDPERNETQARRALLDHLPVDPARVHPMPAAGGTFGTDPDTAAKHYAGLLAAGSGPDAADVAVPAFDVLMLGVGGEGHVASLFPNTPYVREQQRAVVGVYDCPKPPSERVSLTLPAIRAANEVWLLTAGSGKAEAVGDALRNRPPEEIPASGAWGLRRTLWFLDTESAAHAPQE